MTNSMKTDQTFNLYFVLECSSYVATIELSNYKKWGSMLQVVGAILLS